MPSYRRHCHRPRLPNELIVDILSRLAPEDVRRFRCVSKSWCALISDSYFREKHAEHIGNNVNLSLLIVKKMGWLYKVDVKNTLVAGDNAVKVDSCPLFSWGDVLFFEIVSSCNGLVCLFNADSRVAIWNPSTRHYHALPPPMPVLLGGHEYENRNLTTYGFGHDRITCDYKVVAITKMVRGNDIGIGVRVYSLKNKSWAKESQIFPNIIVYHTEYGTYASTSNALHWLMRRENIELIVAFDLGVDNGGYREVQQPEYKTKDVCRTLGVLRGCLCIFAFYNRNSSELWVMKQESWIRLISFADPFPDWFFPVRIMPLVYSRSSDKILLRDGDNEKLIWYDLKTKTFTVVRLKNNLPAHGVCLHQSTHNDKILERRRNPFSRLLKNFRCFKLQ